MTMFNQVHFNKVSSFQAIVSPRIFLHLTGFQIFPLCLKMMTVFPSISLGQLQEGIMIREKVSTLSTFIKFFVIINGEIQENFKESWKNVIYFLISMKLLNPEYVDWIQFMGGYVWQHGW